MESLLLIGLVVVMRLIAVTDDGWTIPGAMTPRLALMLLLPFVGLLAFAPVPALCALGVCCAACWASK